MDRFSMDDDEDELAIKVQRILRRRDDGPGELDRLFREFDRNRDGDISEREFLRAMDKLRLDVTDKEAKRLMRRFDVNNDGRISYREFIRFAEGRGGRATDSEESSLSVSKADVDGLMDRLRGLVQSAARKGVDFRESFEHFDANRDGEIDEREFQRGLERLKLR